MTNKEISEWVEKDADAWSIDASALVAILIDFVQDNNLSKAKAKNLPIHDVSNTTTVNCVCENACREVVKTYESDGMEGMETRDKFIYNECKTALDSDC